MKLKQQLRSITLVPTSGGAFEISVNGAKIYSKLQTGEFPDQDAIVKMVKKAI